MRRDEADVAAWRRAAGVAAHLAPAPPPSPQSPLARCATAAPAAPGARRGPVVMVGGAVMDLQARGPARRTSAFGLLQSLR
jgi:hypothetical protein